MLTCKDGDGTLEVGSEIRRAPSVIITTQGDGSVIQIDSTGKVHIEARSDINIVSKEGSINMTSEQGDIKLSTPVGKIELN